MIKKTILIILFCFCLVLSADAQILQGIMAGQTSAAPTYIFRETWNGSTEDNTWTDSGGSGTWDDDDTTAPICEGTQQLHIANDENRYATVSLSGTNYYTAIVWVPSAKEGDSQTAVFIAAQSDNTVIIQVSMAWSAGNGWLPQAEDNGSAHVANAAAFYTSDTLVYVKLRYTPGSGSDADFKIWTSTDGSSWTAGDHISNSAETSDPARIRMYAAASDELYIDDIRVDSSDINYAALDNLKAHYRLAMINEKARGKQKK